jgi:phage terminase small subunit
MVDTPRAPAHLGSGAHRLWREVLAVADMRHDELVLLEKACRTLDDLDRLEKALAASPVLVAGSMGQEKVNPLFAECRSARSLLAALLKQIGVPDPVEVQKIRAISRSTQATKAARARWTRPTTPRRSA